MEGSQSESQASDERHLGTGPVLCHVCQEQIQPAGLWGCQDHSGWSASMPGASARCQARRQRQAGKIETLPSEHRASHPPLTSGAPERGLSCSHVFICCPMSRKFLPSRLRTTLSKATEQIRTQKMQLTAQGRGHLFLQLTLGTAAGRGLQASGVGQD